MLESGICLLIIALSEFKSFSSIPSIKSKNLSLSVDLYPLDYIKEYAGPLDFETEKPGKS